MAIEISGVNNNDKITASDGTIDLVVDLSSLNASNLDSGIIPNGRFPTTLPATSGANLTALNASEITSGTLPIARGSYVSIYYQD